jgi:hypothetical protein
MWTSKTLHHIDSNTTWHTFLYLFPPQLRWYPPSMSFIVCTCSLLVYHHAPQCGVSPSHHDPPIHCYWRLDICIEPHYHRLPSSKNFVS